jgi:hypothetical protein
VEGILIAAGVALVGIILALVAKLLGVDIDVSLSPPRFKVIRHQAPPEPPTDSVLPSDEPPAPTGTAVERERDQLREALFQFSEAVQALDALLECNPADADRIAHDWFGSLATWLASSLRTSTTERYRVSIWTSGGDPDNFDAVGLGMFDPNDKRMRKLSRRGSIGGEAFHSNAGEKYCPDIRAQSCGWTPRSTSNPPYRSLFAVALGEHSDRWGVMTIDCNLEDGFSEADRQVARHFGELALVGALIWRIKAERIGTDSPPAA